MGKKNEIMKKKIKNFINIFISIYKNYSIFFALLNSYISELLKR